MDKQSHKINYDNKSEKIMYRILRCVIIFAVVMIVGYMASHIESEETTAEKAQTEAEQIDADRIQAAIEQNSQSQPEIKAVEESVQEQAEVQSEIETREYRFRNKKLLNQHYEKHGIEMGFASAAEYEAAASAVVNNPEALYKVEAEDGDDVYYLEATNEFVIVSTDGYLRTYFNPGAGRKYFDRQ